MQCRSLHCFPITGDAFYHYVMVFLEICCFKIPPLSCIIHFCWDCTLLACFMEKLCSRWVKALLFSPSCSNKRIRCECNGRTPSQRSSRCFLRVPRWSWHSCGAFAQEVQRCQHGDSDSGFNVWKCIIWSKVLSIDGIKRHRRRLTDSFFLSSLLWRLNWGSGGIVQRCIAELMTCQTDLPFRDLMPHLFPAPPGLVQDSRAHH